MIDRAATGDFIGDQPVLPVEIEDAHLLGGLVPKSEFHSS